MKIFFSENYLSKFQNIEFKRTIINLIKEFKEFKEDISTHLHELYKYGKKL